MFYREQIQSVLPCFSEAMPAADSNSKDLESQHELSSALGTTPFQSQPSMTKRDKMVRKALEMYLQMSLRWLHFKTLIQRDATDFCS